MTDQYDRATEIEEALRDDALRAQERRAGLHGKTVADSATHCGCGAPIPQARREALPGVETCIDCQIARERRARAAGAAAPIYPEGSVP